MSDDVWETLACGCRRTRDIDGPTAPDGFAFRLPVLTFPCFEHWQQQIAEHRRWRETVARCEAIAAAGGCSKYGL